MTARRILWTCLLVCQCQEEIKYPANFFPDTYLTVKASKVKAKYVFHKKIVEVEKRSVASFDLEVEGPGITINCTNVVYFTTYLAVRILGIHELLANYSTPDEWLSKEGIKPTLAADKDLLVKAWKEDGGCLKKALGKQWIHRIVFDPNIQIIVNLEKVGGAKSPFDIFPIDELPDVDDTVVTTPFVGTVGSSGSSGGNSSKVFGVKTSTLLLSIGGGALAIISIVACAVMAYMMRVDGARQRFRTRKVQAPVRGKFHSLHHDAHHRSHRSPRRKKSREKNLAHHDTDRKKSRENSVSSYYDMHRKKSRERSRSRHDRSHHSTHRKKSRERRKRRH